MSSSFSSMSPEKFAAFVETQVDAFCAQSNRTREKPVAVIPADLPAESSMPAAPAEASVQPENPGLVAVSSSKKRKRSRPGRHKPKKPARRVYYPGIAQLTFERHRRLCSICQHPDRQSIESDFLEWRDPNEIYKDHKVGYNTLYRHARAAGLLQQRQENVAVVVHKVLELVDGVPVPSVPEILSAVRTLACLNERGQWIRPPSTHIISGANRMERARRALPELPGAGESSPALPGAEPQEPGVDGEFQYSNSNGS